MLFTSVMYHCSANEAGGRSGSGVALARTCRRRRRPVHDSLRQSAAGVNLSHARPSGTYHRMYFLCATLDWDGPDDDDFSSYVSHSRKECTTESSRPEKTSFLLAEAFFCITKKATRPLLMK